MDAKAPTFRFVVRDDLPPDVLFVAIPPRYDSESLEQFALRCVMLKDKPLESQP